MSDLLRRELGKLLPEESILRGTRAEAEASGDGGSPVLLAPGSVAQVAAVLEKASREGWRVRPSGLGAWPGWEGTSDVDIVLSTRSLRVLESYEPADLTLTAKAGIPWTSLQSATREHGQWLPLDPPGVRNGTLGGLVATGMAGPLRQAYGPPRDHILGVTMVSGDGRILNWGGRVVKNVAGFDVTRLSIGSWGALGVITSVSTRLFPLPRADLTLLIGAPSAEDLLPVSRAMALSPLPFSAVELLDPLDLPPSEPGVGAAGSPGAALVLRVVASEAQAREVEARVRRELPRSRSVRDRSIGCLRNGESTALHEALEGWEEGSSLVLRLSLLPSRMGVLLQEARALEDRVGPVRLAAHVGWGILRVAIPNLPRGGEGMGDLKREIESLRNRLEAGGGSLSLSGGPAPLVEELGSWGREKGVFALMRGLRAKFDPAGILTPGRAIG